MHHTSSSPNDEDDSAPFLMSRVIQRDGWHRGDISTITSPCFEAEKQSRSKSPIGSLFSRLSRGLRVDNSKPGHGKGSPATPATPKSPNGFESISTIKAEGSIVGIENEVNTRGKTANSAGFTKISQRDHNYDRHAFPGSQNESMPDLLRELAGLSVSDGRLSGDVTRDSARSEWSRHVGRVRQQDGMVSDNSHRNSPDEMEFATGRSAATTYSIPSRSNSASPEESILQGRSSQSRLKNFFPSSQDVPAIHYRKQHRPGKEDLQNSACSFEKKLDPKFIAEPFSRKQQHTINNSNESSTHEVNSPLQQRIHHVNFDSKTSREMLCPIQLKTDDSKSGKKNADCMKTTNSLSDERSTTASQSFDKSADTQSIRSENEWREVIDPESGCKYYYNRKTRISKWRLPKGAILAKPRKSSRGRISNSKIQIHSAIKSGVQHHESLFPTVSKTAVQSRSSKSYNPNNSMRSAESSSSNKESPMNMIHRSITSKPCLATTSTTRTKSDAKTRSVAHFMSPQDNANESTNAEGQSRRSIFYLKSPQDCKSGDSIVFCLYCGLKCQSAAILGSHLAQCIHFSRMQGQEHLSAHIEIEKALFIAWSKIDCTYKATVNNVTEKKSNPFDQNDRSYSGVSSYSQDSSQFCHPSPEKAAVISSDPSAKDRSFETSFNEYISYSNAPDDSQNRIQNIANDFNIDTKKCPFCSKNFTQGNHLSGHLLNCSERRRLRKQRRSKTRGNCSLVERRNKNTTPGRKMPWE